MNHHIQRSIVTALVLIACVSADKPAQYNVSSVDGHTVVGINATTGLVDHLYASNGSGGPLIDIEIDARTILEGCDEVPGSLSYVVQGKSVTALRTVSCATSAAGSPFQVKLTEYYVPRNTSVQWKATLLILSAPDCQASRCQPCIPSNVSATGNCCGYMECLYDKVFKEYICLPNEPWICEAGGQLSHPPALFTPSSDIPGYTGTISVPIVTQLSWLSDGKPTQHWAAWGKGSVKNGGPSQPISTGDWSNPLQLEPLPSSQTSYRFGARPSADASIDVVSLPVVTHAFASDVGVSFALDPNDSILDVFFNVSVNGTMIERRYLRQTGGSDAVVFSGYFTAHAADWRPALGFFVNEFSPFFTPFDANLIKGFYGLASHSDSLQPFDANRGHSLDLAFNLDVAGMFMPFSGLFLPYEEPWLNQGTPTSGADQYNVTFDAINDHYVGLAQEGFQSLSYFDIAAWGVNVTLPPSNSTPDYCGYRPPYNFPAPCPNSSGASHYLQDHYLQTAINNSWSVDDGYRSGLLFTDVGAVLMDPFSTGDPIELAALLLDQLSRHITKLGNNVGVVFDHLGVSELYNLAEDDGLSWIPVSESGERGPGRSLRDTFQQFFASAAALLHNSSHPRLMFANCDTVCRIDLLEGMDGIVTTSGALNAIAWTSVVRPAILWTYDLSSLTEAEMDVYFGQHLLMKVFPVAPMDGNVNAIQPGNLVVDTEYQDHAPMFTALASASWCFDASPIIITNYDADTVAANVFDNGESEVLVVVLALEAGVSAVDVKLAHLPKTGNDSCTVSALYPGVSQWKLLGSFLESNGAITFTVPIVRASVVLRVN